MGMMASTAGAVTIQRWLTLAGRELDTHILK